MVGVGPNNLDPFVVFGLPPSASMDQIRRRYRQLAFAYHPDRNPHGDAAQAKKFMLVCEAYEAILKSREATERNQAYGSCALCGGVALLVPRLDGRMVCAPCLLRPASMRLLPPPPIVFVKCYFPILCLLTSTVLVILLGATERIAYGVLACGVALLGFVVVGVLGWLYPVKMTDPVPQPRGPRARRRRFWARFG
jgi:hypothetical protein